jgi:alpha-1,2-mannosyltransferase
VGTTESERTNTVALAIGALVLIAGGIFGAAWMLHPFVRKWDLVDLAVYRTAARAVTHGHSVYGSWVHDHLRVPLPFIYPPVSAVAAVPLTWLGETQANLLWTAITIGLLVAIVRVCFTPLLARYPRTSWLATFLILGAVCALAPVEDHLRFGQVGIALMACCIFDCLTRNPRWPRGLLVGIATAIKLVPGIFIPYLWFTGRKRAALVAVATTVGLTLVGFVFAPGDSWKFFTNKMFSPTSPTFFSNQSLEGILQRAVGGPWRILWLAAVVAVLVYGLTRAVAASKMGDELRGIALTGLVGALVSPMAWIHHLVWVIPALAVILGDGRDRKRTIIAFVIAALFVARIPYIGNDELHGTGFVANLFQDSYGFLCIGLLIYLGRPLRTSRPIEQPLAA